MENKKSLWPIGILLVILLGVILIIASVRISKMQNIDPNLTYGMKKIDMDKNANDILQKQNAFEAEFSAYLGINNKDILLDSNTSKNANFSTTKALKSPYYATPVPSTLPNSKEMLHGNDSLYLIFKPKNSKNPNAINDLANDIESISLLFSRILIDNKNLEKIDFKMELNAHESDTLIYVANNISLPHKGYYEADFNIKLKDNENTIVFSKWIFNNGKISK